MIVEGIVKVAVAFFKFVLGLFPTRNPPQWTESLASSLQTVWDAGAGLGAWIPWGNVAAVVQAVIACMITGLLIRLVRIVLSLFTGGGGSAA